MGLAGQTETMGDSHEIELVLNHAKNMEDLTLGPGNPAQGTLTANQSTLYDKYIFLEKYKQLALS